MHQLVARRVWVGARELCGAAGQGSCNRSTKRQLHRVSRLPKKHQKQKPHKRGRCMPGADSYSAVRGLSGTSCCCMPCQHGFPVMLSCRSGLLDPVSLLITPLAAFDPACHAAPVLGDAGTRPQHTVRCDHESLLLSLSLSLPLTHKSQLSQDSPSYRPRMRLSRTWCGRTLLIPALSVCVSAFGPLKSLNIPHPVSGPYMERWSTSSGHQVQIS